MRAQIASTLADPSSMAFIKLPTDLHDLVLFDTGQRRLKEKELAAERQYRDRRGSQHAMVHKAFKDTSSTSDV